MNSQEILQLLDEHNITYRLLSHPAVFTSEEADQHLKDKDFAKCKNLFIKTRNSKHYYLLMLPEDKKIDWQKTKAELHSSSLTFVSETEREEKLQIKSGSVSPFSLLNDTTNTIPLIVDQAAMEESNLVGVHPNDNPQTISLSWTELARILSSTGHLFEERSL
ncbi:aminoacyl-tRNA deacylase [Lactobacillus kefiranofaciens]|uniref:YbaK/EbsC family protein n=1 Tax=Lactobacillus kefiranofaciens TaxID=267818 RepID=UPI0024696B25|nr:YbaK/EbsC family protein [Lactobacillus kefiranofaciens]MDH5100623.1 aminoacyl-tRNA deacylase [Lactobacillus kefiranofaciens]